MTREKDDVSYPYDWVDPQVEYWATHCRKEYGLRSAAEQNVAWQLQRARDLQNVWPNTQEVLETYDRAISEAKEYRARLDAVDALLRSDPWSNGRYALAALVWGLILLVVFGVGAGP